MSKRVEVNSPYFISIPAAQNNIPKGDGALILPLPTPAVVVLRIEVVLSLFVTYIYHILTDMFITLFIQNIFLLSASICFFFFQSNKKNGKVIKYIHVTVEWLIGKLSRTLDLVNWSLRL